MSTTMQPAQQNRQTASPIEQTRPAPSGAACAAGPPVRVSTRVSREERMSLEQTLNDEERLADLDLDQLKQLVGLVEYDASADPFPVSGLGRPGLGRRQRRPDRALLPVRVRHGAGRLLRPRDRQPRPPRLRAAVRRRPLRRHRRLRPGQPAGRPPPRARRRHRRHRAVGARRRPLHRARAGAGRDGPRAAARRHRRARHGADRPPSPPTATPGTRWSTGPATPAPTCPATSRGRRPS